MDEHELTVAAQIWNRALLEDVSSLREGDRALAGMALADSLIMHDGVLNAVEIYSESAGEMTAAVAGFLYFGLPQIVSLLAEAMEIFLNGDEEELDKHAVALDERYWALAAEGNTPYARFEAVLLANPSAFAPLSDQ
ncbi:hypothetical protein [Reyranella sp.]|uniref:hypothetical protein n=1 Tax=Reyranella sp. TaxID=1929291 RepID=UPI003D0B8D8F